MIPKKILIVDDEKDILISMQELLEMEGYEVVCAQNGRNALEILKNLKPDIMIVDVMMPIMGGEELVGKIRNDSQYAKTPIILMSAIASFARRERQGWQAFIKKPTDIDLILETIKALL